MYDKMDSNLLITCGLVRSCSTTRVAKVGLNIGQRPSNIRPTSDQHNWTFTKRCIDLEHGFARCSWGGKHNDTQDKAQMHLVVVSVQKFCYKTRNSCSTRTKNIFVQVEFLKTWQMFELVEHRDVARCGCSHATPTTQLPPTGP